jgi:hypothetical protein
MHIPDAWVNLVHPAASHIRLLWLFKPADRRLTYSDCFNSVGGVTWAAWQSEEEEPEEGPKALKVKEARMAGW